MTKFTSEDYGEGYWERAEGSNYQNYGDDPGWASIVHVINDLRGPGLRILEAACAKGYFVHRAVRSGHDAVGFDLSEYAISKSVQPMRTQVHDATSCPWPYEESAFDIVCAWEFLEHIPEEDTCQVLECMRAATKVGGELWLKTGIVVPEDHDFAGQEDHDHTHVNMHDREWWETEAAGHGFEIQRDVEARLDEEFKNRDWKGRFFVWRKPE